MVAYNGVIVSKRSVKVNGKPVVQNIKTLKERRQTPLEHLFNPQSIAIVGASRDPKKWGFHLLLNVMKGGYAGRIYPVNAREKEILGFKAYATVAQIPEAVDLVLLIVPPSDILKVLHDCGKNRAKIGVVITAGFSEVSHEGRKLEEEMVGLARSLGMRLVGPNCQGIVTIGSHRLYAHMPPQFPESGPLGLVSQSGNLATSIIELANPMYLGFSRIISSGNEADLQTIDFLEYLAEDPQTEVILSYLEGIKDGERFIKTAKKISSQKPLVMVKAGRTEAGIKAAFSHTGALTGSANLFDGLCRQAGIIRADTLEEMVDIAVALLTQPLTKGKRVGILTLGGGWGVLAADYCAKADLTLPDLSREMVKTLDRVLPPWWNRINPVDMVAGYRKGDLIQSLELFLRSEQFDGVLMLGLGWRVVRGSFLRKSAHTPGDEMEMAGRDWIEEEQKIFSDVQELGRKYEKPILLASDMVHLIPGYAESLRGRRVAAYPSLHRAVRAYRGLVQRYEILKRAHGSKGSRVYVK
jgi:acyl-CoA synthetase (NDP forming)